MTDLADFLLARIAEDEAAMRALLGYQHWADGQPPPEATTPMARVLDWTLTPARVLAECDAKRRIVEAEVLRDVGPASHYVSPEVHARISARTATTVMRLLALPYADDPDFREEWKP